MVIGDYTPLIAADKLISYAADPDLYAQWQTTLQLSNTPVEAMGYATEYILYATAGAGWYDTMTRSGVIGVWTEEELQDICKTALYVMGGESLG